MSIEWVGNHDLVGHKNLSLNTRVSHTMGWYQLTISSERQLWLGGVRRCLTGMKL